MLLHYVPLFIGWLVRGDARRSPLLDSTTRQPIVTPERIHAPMLERAEARAPKSNH